MSTSKSPSITKMVKYRMIRMRSKPDFLQYNSRNKLIRGSSTRSWEAALLSLISDHCTRGLQDTSRATIHFILATKTGFVARSNLFRDRLAQFAPVIQFVDLSVFGKRYRARSLNDSLENLLSHALYVFTSDPSKSEADLSQLPNIEPSTNTIMGLILDTMPQRKTIAFIHGRDDFFAAQPILNTADDLGIDLVILDRAGHWLLDSKYTHLYKEFEPLDMTIDEDFPARIVTAIKRHKVDGVCTVSDRCLFPVSKAASILGLPTDHISHCLALLQSKSNKSCFAGRKHGDSRPAERYALKFESDLGDSHFASYRQANISSHGKTWAAVYCNCAYDYWLCVHQCKHGRSSWCTAADIQFTSLLRTSKGLPDSAAECRTE